MSEGMIAALLVGGFAASCLGGMLGMAGGVFIIPFLTVAIGLDIQTAIGVSLVSVIACSCSSAAPFLRERFTNIRLANLLEVATTSGALTGVLLLGVFPDPALYVLLALVMAISAQQMLVKRTSHENADPVAASTTAGLTNSLNLHSAYPVPPRGHLQPYQVQRLPMGVGLMYGAGLLSALLGIGSGVLKIPAMDSALRLPIKVSTATSNFMIGVTATAGAGAYLLQGRIDSSIAGPVVLGSVAGSVAGAHILMKISSSRVRLLFAIVLVVLALQMVLSGLGIHITGEAA